MKKVLVLCSGNASRSQMAEAYLNVYGEGYGIYVSAGVEAREIDPLTIQVMAEDNIDITDYQSKSYHQFTDQTFDYLIVVSDKAHEALPDVAIQASKQFQYPIPDPATAPQSGEERLSYFREIRETVKKYILKFIGQEILPQDEALIA